MILAEFIKLLGSEKRKDRQELILDHIGTHLTEAVARQRSLVIGEL